MRNKLSIVKLIFHRNVAVKLTNVGRFFWKVVDGVDFIQFVEIFYPSIVFR